MLILSFFVLILAAVSPSEGQELKLLRGNCRNFWYSFDGRCYKYIATPMTWADAELHCVSQGANLVSIHSLEEHNFVNFLIKNLDPNQGFTWNGLSDLHKEGAWLWSDGSKLSFDRWAATQPDNAGGKEHCGHTNSGSDFKWNDYPCSDTYSFVCASRNICP